MTSTGSKLSDPQSERVVQGVDDQAYSQDPSVLEIPGHCLRNLTVLGELTEHFRPIRSADLGTCTDRLLDDLETWFLLQVSEES